MKIKTLSYILLIALFSNGFFVVDRADASVVIKKSTNVVQSFTASGTFNVPSDISSVQVLIVAGGGGGGSNAGGGGGGGGVIATTTTVTPGAAMSVTVGSGGAGGSSAGVGGSGGNSSFNSMTAVGGGGGGSNSILPGVAGGSGGGGAGTGAPGSGGSGTAGQGYAGGNNIAAGPVYGSGGGGGASHTGFDGSSSAGGNGGDGVASSITGSSVSYGGGGGGSTYAESGIAGTGGLGGGGAASVAGTGTNGTSNTGGGGGGGHYSSGTGGSGGSGIVIVKYTRTVNGTPVTSAKVNKTNTSIKATIATSSVLSSASGITGYWKFDEGSGSTALDSSGNGRTGSLNNSPTYTTGKFNQGLNFNGSSQAVTAGTSGLITGSAGTVSLWLKTTANHDVFNSHSGGWNQNTVWLSGGNLTLRLGGGSPTSDITTSGVTLTDGSWHYVVVRWTAGGERSIWVDGVSRASDTGTATFTPGSNFELGYKSWSADYYVGDMDEVQFYTRALTQSEIQAIYTGSGDPLLVHYTFDGATISGNIISDISGNNVSATQYPSSSGGAGWIVSGLEGGYSSGYDGTYLQVPDINGSVTFKMDDTHYLFQCSQWIDYGEQDWMLGTSVDCNSGYWEYQGYGPNPTPTPLDVYGWYAYYGDFGTNPTLTAYSAPSVSIGPWKAAGKIGQAIGLDGSTQYVQASATALPTGTSARSVCAWASPDSTSAGYHDIFAYGVGTTDNAFKLQRNGADLVGSGWSDDITASSFFTANTWKQVCLTYDGTTAKLYGNGALLTSGAVSWDTTATSSMYIGASVDGASEFWNGKIDDLSVYRSVLTATEIASFYTKQVGNKVSISSGQNTKSTNGLVGLWSFNGKDLSGTTAYDRSGQGHNGTLTNGPRVAIGKVGQALKFDGVDDYVTIPDSATFSPGSGDFSFGVWAKTSSVANYVILQKYGGAGTPTYQIAFNADGTLGAYMRDDSGNAVNPVSATVYADNNWHHVFAVRTGTTLKLYVDGVLIDTQTNGSLGTVTATGGSQPLSIGRVFNFANSQSSGYLAGSIDEVRVYNRALTAAEVTQLYNLGK